MMFKKRRDTTIIVIVLSIIVFRVVTSHYVSHHKNKYAASCHQIHKKLICPEHFTDNIERKYFCFALKRRLSDKMISGDDLFKRDKQFWGGRGFVEIIAVFPESSTGSQSILLKRIFFST